MPTESGGVLDSTVMTKKDQARIIQGSQEHIDTLERYGFKSAREVWNTYLRAKVAGLR